MLLIRILAVKKVGGIKYWNDFGTDVVKCRLIGAM
jgi:hypothetical protein